MSTKLLLCKKKANIIKKMTQRNTFHLMASHVTSIIMSQLTVVSLSEAQENMEEHGAWSGGDHCSHI